MAAAGFSAFIILAGPRPATVKAVRTTDGDTVVVLKSGAEVIVRLAGVDCPEKDQPFGDDAAAFTAEMTGKAKQIRLLPGNTDRYGRRIARLECDGVDLSFALVAHGLAWHYRDYSDDPDLQAAEDTARKSRAGLWRAPNPIPPWTWRKSHN